MSKKHGRLILDVTKPSQPRRSCQGERQVIKSQVNSLTHCLYRVENREKEVEYLLGGEMLKRKEKKSWL